MATRKQHVVPQFYLRGFANEDRAWASRKDQDGRLGNLFITDIDNLCSKRDYYEVKDKADDGQVRYYRRNSIEHWLSSLEHELAIALQAVRAARTTLMLQSAVNHSLYPLKIMLANLIMRHPMVLNPSRKISAQLTDTLLAEKLLTNEELKKS